MPLFRKFYQKARYAATALSKERAKRLLLAAELEESRALHRYTKSGKRRKHSSDQPLRLVMTTAGSYRIAVNRSLSHTGQSSLAATLDASVGRWAVTRAELLLGIYFDRAAATWYDSMHAAMQATRGETTRSYLQVGCPVASLFCLLLLLLLDHCFRCRAFFASLFASLSFLV
jgi:hypothetical protein